MDEPQVFCFAPFRLDVRAERLWRDTDVVQLTAKAFGVLRYLVEHAGRLVTKDALFTALWPETTVSEAALTVYISEIRRALGETTQRPQFLETVRGRGYRFVAPVTLTASAVVPALAMPSPPGLPWVSAQVPASSLLVGREAELAQLQQRWVRAQQGFHQVVLITGEAGIGKTALVDALVVHMAAPESVWYGRGQCVEQHGAGEAYLPLFECLGQMGRGPYGATLLEVFSRYAPTWLLQMPGLLSTGAFDALQRRAMGATQERMLRELAEAVEVLSEERPMLLVLEDLHWSDVSTLDWLAYVARRRQAARLLVVGTYRPTDALVRGHPVHTVTQDLLRQGHGVEMALESLSAAGVGTYLAQRFGEAPQGLTQTLHQHTEGHPFFLVTVVDELVRRGALRQGDSKWELADSLDMTAVEVPTSVHEMIMQQVERCDPEVQTLLEVASVTGPEFPAAAVAAGLEQAIETVEAHCNALVRREQFLWELEPAEWPDGTVTARYRFRHDLYREVLYERVPVSRRVRWHRQIGGRLETAYRSRAQELAAELAEHFVRGRDTARAVQYLRYAGEQATQRSAYKEALQHFTHGLQLLSTLPETLERAQQELALQLALGAALNVTQGAANPAVEQAYNRARALCAQVGETLQLVPMLRGLWRFYLNRGALSTVRELGEQILHLVQHEAVPVHRLEAHDAFGTTYYYLGEFTTARTHLEQGLTGIDPTVQQAQLLRDSVAPGVSCLSKVALTLWHLGFPLQAQQRSQEALALAQTLCHTHSLAYAQRDAALLHYWRRDVPATLAQAEALLALAQTEDLVSFVRYGILLRGWALAAQGQGDLEQLRQSLGDVVASGQALVRARYLLLLAEAVGYGGQLEEGLELLTEALVAMEAIGEGDLLAETYRLRGEFLLRQASAPAPQVEACLYQALTVARRQQARSWELRAALSLARLWHQQGKRAEARALLVPIYGWFTEGFDTVDLQDAKTLLAALT